LVTDIGALGDTLLGETDLDREIGANAHRTQLERAVRTASEMQRLTLELFYFEGLDLRRDQRKLNQPLGEQPPPLLIVAGTVKKKRLGPEASGNQTMLDGHQGREYHEKVKDFNAVGKLRHTHGRSGIGELNSHLTHCGECPRSCSPNYRILATPRNPADCFGAYIDSRLKHLG